MAAALSHLASISRTDPKIDTPSSKSARNQQQPATAQLFA